MNHVRLAQLPTHITHVRRGSVIFERLDKNEWQPKEYMTISNAKRYVRLDLKCVGGPKSFVRTAASLDLE